MIVRIRFIQTEPDKFEKGRSIWDNEVAPLLKKQKGFHRAFRAEDRDEPGGGVVVEFWESSEAEEAWRMSKDFKESARMLLPLVNELTINRPFELGKEI